MAMISTTTIERAEYYTITVPTPNMSSLLRVCVGTVIVSYSARSIVVVDIIAIGKGGGTETDRCGDVLADDGEEETRL